MKYFFLPIVLFLTACSLDKNSTYWNNDSKKKTFDNVKSNKMINEIRNFKSMKFEEFSLFLNEYSVSSEFPDIDN